MKKCFIAITQRLYAVQEYDEVRETLSLDWGTFFTRYLGEFLMLPLSHMQDFNQYRYHIAGVILSGGNDLSIHNNNVLNRQRDEFEFGVIESCVNNSIPLLGVCRGAQIIAHYFNSTINKCSNHVGSHEVIQHSSTMFQNNIQTDCIESENSHQIFDVNSYHNYAIQALGENLKEIAVCGDKENLLNFSIEAFRHNTYNIFGIMWHIERSGGMCNDFVFNLWKNTIKYN